MCVFSVSTHKVEKLLPASSSLTGSIHEAIPTLSQTTATDTETGENLFLLLLVFQITRLFILHYIH